MENVKVFQWLWFFGATFILYSNIVEYDIFRTIQIRFDAKIENVTILACSANI